MMKRNPVRWALVLWVILATGFPVYCPAQSRPRAAVGPDAVWSPLPNSWARLQQSCGNGNRPECLPAFMRQNGASPEAVAVAQRFHGESFISDFRNLGRIGLATLVSPFQANANETPILVNGTPDIVEVADETNKVDPDRNASYASVKQAVPNAVFGAAVPRFEGMQELTSGGQRFVFLISVRDGCIACDEVAVARLALDFDQFGLYLGPKLLSVIQAARERTGAAIETSHSPGTGQPSNLTSAVPARLITRDSVGPVRIGMTVSQARRLLPRFQVERATIEDGAVAYKVFTPTQTTMFLIPVFTTRTSNQVDESAVIHTIEVVDPSYATEAGVRPGMPLRDVEAIYGKLLRISMSEIEMEEFATFSKSPAGISIRVSAKDRLAGIYSDDKRSTDRYDAGARVQDVLVSAVGMGRPHPSQRR